jgi:murein biosynthesis integral membrane protein MurJ
MSLTQPKAYTFTSVRPEQQTRVFHGPIVRALVSLASAALFVRAAGMVNQIVVSASFGAGPSMDAYFVAAAFPLLLVQLLSSATEAAVIPVYSQLRMHSSRKAISTLFSTLLNCLVLGTLPLVLLLLILRQSLVYFSAPGLDPVRLAQAVALAPPLILVVPLGLVIGLLECILNAEGQFGWPAYAGLLVPLTTAVLTALMGKTWGVMVLCLGSLLGTILQLLIIFVRVRQARLRYRPVVDWRNPYLGKILRAAWPVLLGALISQGSPLVDQIFASTLPAGTISALNYSLKLISVFSGVIFVSVGRALLPSLARQAALGDRDGYQAFKRILHLSLWCVGLCVLVLSIALLLLAPVLLSLLFQHGAFSAGDTRDTAVVLSGFGIGLMPMAIGFLLSRAFNALGETRVPMCIALVSLGADFFFDALFAHFWQGLGIALATSAVYIVTSLLLLFLLYRRIGTFNVWRVPPEVRAFSIRFWGRRRTYSHIFARDWRDVCLFKESFCRNLLFAGITLLVMAAGVLATVRDALATLRVASGMLVVLFFLRYPYILLLAWASINVCIGSTLTLFNGNNLDMALIIPLLLLLLFLPWKELFQRMPGLIWQALYPGWVLAGIGLSPLDTRSFLTLWLIMFASIAVGPLAVTFIITRRRLLGLIDMLLMTAFLAALYGLYGYMARQHGEVDAETQLFRITSLFTQATTFAFYLSLVLPLALYRCLFSTGIGRLAALVCMLCLLGALLLTFTRSAYAGVFLEALIMLLCISTRRTRFWLASGLIALCGLVLFLGWSGQMPFLARFFNSDLTTLNGRIYLWQALLSRFQITQWLGNGLQSSDQLLTYLHVGASGQGLIGTAPHNLFLGTLYDHGVIGLCLLCGMFFSLGSSLLKGMRRSGGERRVLYAAALAALVNALLQSIGSRDLWIQAVGVSFWIVVALPFVRFWSVPQKTPDEATRSESIEQEKGYPDQARELCDLPGSLHTCPVS